MIINWNKYDKKPYRNIQDGMMPKDVFDKNGNNIVDTAETLEGLGLTGDELKEVLVELSSHASKTTTLIKETEYIYVEEDDQRLFELTRITPGDVVELRVNSVWMEENAFSVQGDKLILDDCYKYKKGKRLDVIYYKLKIE